MPVDAVLVRIKESDFFSNMGTRPSDTADLIYADSLREVFAAPDEPCFNPCFKAMEWLPTSPTQNDPFYALEKPGTDLVELRISITKAVMGALKDHDKTIFIVDQHDFSGAARNAIGFAFRQYATERYYGLGSRWKKIVEVYYSGHWPVGYSADKLIVV